LTRIKDMMRSAVDAGASDLHILAGHPPLLRIHTVLVAMEGEAVVAEDEAHAFVKELVTEEQHQHFTRLRDLDFSASLPGGPRFRVNAHFQRGTPALAFRAIPARVPPLEELNLPEVVVEFAELQQGLVLVTGETAAENPRPSPRWSIT